MDTEFEHRCDELRTKAEAALVEPDTLQQDTTGNEARGNGEAGEKQSAAKKLVLIGEQAELFHDDRRDGYAVVKHEGVRMTVRLGGRDFRRWLGRQYWVQYQSAPNNEAIQTALNVLEAKAVFDGRCLALSNRFAYRDGTIHVDLADVKWRVVKVTADGWELLQTRPALFRRHSHQRPLPAPERGGSLDDLRGFLNVKSDDDWLLLKAWLATAALEDIPRPIVTFHGAQGSGKSTAARVLRNLLDPSAVDNLSFPKKHDELAQVLDHHALPCFDNLKTVDSASADMLCRAVTGGGLSKRELFTDAEDIILSFKRALILNGINIPTHAPDLLDRMVLIELERIPEHERRTEAELWRDFDAAHPRLFGALLDAMVVMLGAQPQAQNRLPRMADFATWGARWAGGTGTGSNAFLAAYNRNISRQTEEAVEADDVAVAVRSLATGGPWQGAPSELLSVLNARRGNAPAPDGWPKNARSLGRRLRVLQTTLAQVGVRASFGHSGNRTISISMLPEKTSETLETSKRNSSTDSEPGVSAGQTSNGPLNVQQTSTRKANACAGLDDMDVMDVSCGCSVAGVAGAPREIF